MNRPIQVPVQADLRVQCLKRPCSANEVLAALSHRVGRGIACGGLGRGSEPGDRVRRVLRLATNHDALQAVEASSQHF